VFEAKKILFNIYSGADSPLIIEEMSAVSNFMKRFGPEIEVIWGTAIDKGLDKQIKITLLAAGFGMENIPGINEIPDIFTENNLEEEEERLQMEEEKRRINKMIEDHYGKNGVKPLDVRSTFFTPKPIILSSEELDNDKIIEALENTPVFKRDDKFNPMEYKPEKKDSGGLFNGEY